MEAEFDKEIDALLRNAAVTRAAPRDVTDGHLSSDEIAAFAESAVPGPARNQYILHFGACDRCRAMLATVISLNSETPAAVPALPDTAPAVSAAWYSRFLQFPNLAYVMGGLVLIFAGFFTFSIVRNADRSGVQVSQVEQQPESSTGGPSAEQALDNPFIAATNSASANANANTTAMMNTATVSRSDAGAPANVNVTARTNPEASNTSVGVSPPPRAALKEDNNFSVDGSRSAESGVALDSTASAPKPPSPPQKADRESDAMDARITTRQMDALPMSKQKDAKSLARLSPGVAAQSPAARRRSGPMNSQAQNQANNVGGNALGSSAIRTVSGRNFELKQGVWYDRAFRGESTKNFRRGTDAYKRLDGGLRSIAESLGGTVVVVWKGSAYRIN